LDPTSTPDDAIDHDPTPTPDDARQPEIDVPATSTPDPSSTPPAGQEDDNATNHNDDPANNNDNPTDGGDDDSSDNANDDPSAPPRDVDAPSASPTEPQPIGLISVVDTALAPPDAIAPMPHRLPSAGEGVSARQQAFIELLAMALAAAGLAGIATGMRRRR
jgi:hypothetical protein